MDSQLQLDSVILLFMSYLPQKEKDILEIAKEMKVITVHLERKDCRIA
jgi:hypothetical protein